MRECRAEGCPHPAPSYDEFCEQHSPPNWVCEDCGCRERWDSAFCYLCGAGQPEAAAPSGRDPADRGAGDDGRAGKGRRG